MTLIAGASSFLNAATLANASGAPQASASPSLLAGFDSNTSLLELGKQFSSPGIGLSASARAITSSFLATSEGGLNTILSAGLENAISDAQTRILALQSTLPASQVGSYSSRDNVEITADAVEENVPADENLGQNIDTEA
jgi:hypothetical protein